MKKIILSAIVVTSILASCSKEEITPNESNSSKGAFKSAILNKNSSASKVQGKEYTEQLPYLDAHTDFLTFSIKNDLNHKMNDPKIDWKTINGLYNSDLSTAEKQFVIYIVLAKKDLLGVQNSTPTKDQANLIVNYAKELISSKYIGYCLLYNILTTLKNTSEYAPFVKALAAQITTDSKNEVFHASFIKKPEGRDPYINKVSEDYKYLDKINTEF